jgi:hypothetical protein
MWVRRRVARIVILTVGSIVGLAIVAGASIGVYNRDTFGTFYTTGAPPRVDYCGRRYYPGGGTEPLAAVRAVLAKNRRTGLTRIGSTPSGLPIVANVMSAADRASYQTEVCTMMLWVQTGPDAYATYELSGGP